MLAQRFVILKYSPQYGCCKIAKHQYRNIEQRALSDNVIIERNQVHDGCVQKWCKRGFCVHEIFIYRCSIEQAPDQTGDHAIVSIAESVAPKHNEVEYCD